MLVESQCEAGLPARLVVKDQSWKTSWFLEAHLCSSFVLVHDFSILDDNPLDVAWLLLRVFDGGGVTTKTSLLFVVGGGEY